MRKFESGTPECGLAMGILGAVIAFMILFLGFWRTAFVALLFAVGYFIGAVANKGEAVKIVINKIFPPKDE
ncbi:MAG: DUF2273 domain-containing protein [Clostridia bacterium]|nr:DUF2273 domain-containing protein [Clostridia bacterium]